MSFRKFDSDDVVVNTIRMHPQAQFYIYNGRCFYNNIPHLSGAATPTSINGATQGSDDIYLATPLKSSRTGSFGISSVESIDHTGSVLSMYEYNINRTRNKYVAAGTDPMGYGTDYEDPRATNAALDPARAPLYGEGQYVIFPYLTKDSARESFKRAMAAPTTWVDDPSDESFYDYEFEYGDVLTGSYPLSASISREWLPYDRGSNASKAYSGLVNTFNHYVPLSEHYATDSTLFNKSDQYAGLIHIPSIFYGSRIKPGTVSLKMFYTGTLIAELRDTKENGELIQVSGSEDASFADGRVAGVALYNEGFLWLTGAWGLNSETYRQQGPSAGAFNGPPRWRYWGAGNGDGLVPTDDSATAKTFAEVSSELTFRGETKTQVLTMYARAPRGKVNYSNNPTFIKYGQDQMSFTSSHVYEENPERLIKNTVSSSYTEPDHTASFKRQVYISKIGIYDANRNLIGVASLANPVKKEEAQDLTFKLKLDM